MSFEQNVFINCPFDNEYKLILKPLLFTLLYIGFEPKLSETSSSGNIRVEEIKKLIRSSQYSIHDISRNESLNPGDLPRFNMPFEMGLDIGCQSFGSLKLKNKKCLILDKERYRYLSFISDIGGQDIKNHSNDPQHLISKVREWFATILNSHLPGPTGIWENYIEFITDMIEQLTIEGFSAHEIDDIPFSNFVLLAKSWINNHH